MQAKRAIEILKTVISDIERQYPAEYAEAIKKAIEALEDKSDSVTEALKEIRYG